MIGADLAVLVVPFLDGSSNRVEADYFSVTTNVVTRLPLQQCLDSVAVKEKSELLSLIDQLTGVKDELTVQVCLHHAHWTILYHVVSAIRHCLILHAEDYL